MIATTQSLHDEHNRLWRPVMVAHQDGARFRAESVIAAQRERRPILWLLGSALSVLLHLLPLIVLLDFTWTGKLFKTPPVEPIYVEFFEQGPERKKQMVEPEEGRKAVPPPNREATREEKPAEPAPGPRTPPAQQRLAAKPQLAPQATQRARPDEVVIAPPPPPPPPPKPEVRKLPENQVNVTKPEEDIPPLRRQATDIVPPDASPETYERILLRHITKFAGYPRAALLAQLQGRGVIAMRMRRDGILIKTDVIRSSGHETLDKAILRAVFRADPLPAPPANWGKEFVDISVPFEFVLER